MLYLLNIYFYHMKNISLKLDPAILKETDFIVSKTHQSRNRYINEAIEHFNRIKRRALLTAQLELESKLLAEESLAILREFEAIDDAREV